MNWSLFWSCILAPIGVLPRYCALIFYVHDVSETSSPSFASEDLHYRWIQCTRSNIISSITFDLYVYGSLLAFGPILGLIAHIYLFWMWCDTLLFAVCHMGVGGNCVYKDLLLRCKCMICCPCLLQISSHYLISLADSAEYYFHTSAESSTLVMPW